MNLFDESDFHWQDEKKYSWNKMAYIEMYKILSLEKTILIMSTKNNLIVVIVSVKQQWSPNLFVLLMFFMSYNLIIALR